MVHVFDQHYTMPTGVLGGNAKDFMVQSWGYIGKDLEFTDNKPLTSWIDATLRLFRNWHQYLDDSNVALNTPLRLIGLKDQPLHDHECLGQTLQTALSETWPPNDKAIDHLSLNGKDSHNKHKVRRLNIQFEDLSSCAWASDYLYISSSLPQLYHCHCTSSNVLSWAMALMNSLIINIETNRQLA